MSTDWLEELLPHAIVSSGAWPKTRILWVLFFALFPLAYLGGIALEMSEDRPARISGAEDRASAIRTAEAFAASKGFAVSDCRHYVVVETHDDLLNLYAMPNRPDLASLSILAPARDVEVLLRPSDQSNDFRVYLSLTGQVTGYLISKAVPGKIGAVTSDFGVVQVHSTTDSASDKDDSASKPQNQLAESLARRELATNELIGRFLVLGKPDIETDEHDSKQTNVTWDSTAPGNQELTFHITVLLRGSDVVGQRIEAHVEKDYLKSNPRKSSKFPTFLNGLYGVFATYGAFYALFRYVKRMLQKEVSHVRTLIVALLLFISYGTFVFSLAVDQLAIHVTAAQFKEASVLSYVAAAVTFALMGLLVGIAYGSGEGELREAYPGKLTSLDALLAGRLFSRDVASSLVFGAAAAGWLLLVHHAISYFLNSGVISAQANVLRYTFARLPWATLLVGKQYDSLLIAAGGLLLPASWLLRKNASKRRRFFWLILFALFSVANDAAGYPTAATCLLAMAIFACALLLPFFAFDLLASMVCLSALAYVDELAELSAAFPSWTNFALSLGSLAVAILAVAGYFALRGRRVKEEDVRPLYAKNLAERMSMQAEILAAREAQLRLLPQSAPEIPGIQLAACCLPAHGVGGDFYDFFPLDAGRIGIFVAQGGDQGLASALCIALAKGVLMYTSLQPHSPTQIIVELEAFIAELLEGGGAGRISFAYGVVDTRRNILNYARIGSSPQLVIHRAGAKVTMASQLERVVVIPGRLKTADSIYEGAAHTQLGDYLIFFTAGLTSLKGRRRLGNRDYQWLDVLMRELVRPDEPLQNALTSALSKYQRHASEDLTAVVLRVVETKALLQEVVA